MSLRGSYLSHEEGSNGGAIHPLGAAPSPIKGGGGDLLSTSSFPLLLTCPLVDIFLPLLVLYSSTCLGEALLSFFSPPPPPCRSAVGVPEDPLLPLPNWSKGRRSSSSCTCDRLWKRCLLQRSFSRS